MAGWTAAEDAAGSDTAVADVDVVGGDGCRIPSNGATSAEKESFLRQVTGLPADATVCAASAAFVAKLAKDNWVLGQEVSPMHILSPRMYRIACIASHMSYRACRIAHIASHISYRIYRIAYIVSHMSYRIYRI